MADLMQVTLRDVRFQLGDLKELETKLGLAAGTLPLANSRQGEDRSEVEGHKFSGKHFHRHRRICPFCIAETGYQRTYWELTFFNRCHLHGVALKDTCDCGQPLKWTDPGLATCIKCITHDPVAPISITLPARPFEDWCLKALNLSDKAPSVEKLDGTPVAEAAGMTTALGLLSRTSFLRDRPEVEDAEVLQDLGYELLISGALDALVASVVDSYRSEGGNPCPPMPANALGWFGDLLLLHQRSAPSPLCRAITLSLGRALGYPVNDPGVSDYVSAYHVSRMTGVTEADLFEGLVKIKAEAEAISLECGETVIPRSIAYQVRNALVNADTPQR